MHTFRLPVLLFLAVGACFGGVSAQSSTGFSGITAYAPASSSRKAPAGKAASTVRTPKRLPQTYSGFAIEVAASNYPLDGGNPVFRQFGNVFYDKLREGGYSYLVKAEFSSAKAALHFVKTVIEPKAPDARLFEYKEGTRNIVAAD